MDLTAAMALVLDLARQNIIESDGHDDMAREMNRQVEACDMIESFIIKQRKQLALKEEQISKALSLPVIEGLPIIRDMIIADYKLIFRKDIADWCYRNSKFILADKRKG